MICSFSLAAVIVVFEGFMKAFQVPALACCQAPSFGRIRTVLGYLALRFAAHISVGSDAVRSDGVSSVFIL